MLHASRLSTKVGSAGFFTEAVGIAVKRIAATTALMIVAAGAVGCGSGGSLALPAPLVYPNITGNWQIQTNAGNATLGVLLAGFLSEKDSVVSGTLQFIDLVPGNACGTAPYTIGVSGTVSTDGKLVLTTATGVNGPGIKVDLQLSPGAYNYAYGTVEVSTPTPCVYATSGALGTHVGEVTGKYAGAPALTGAIPGVGISNAALNLTQSGTANADGSFQVSGNLNFSGAACSVSLPVEGSILGVGVVLNSAPIQGSSQPEVAIEATASSDQSQLYDGTFVFNSGPCTATTSGFAKYQGALKRAN